MFLLLLFKYIIIISYSSINLLIQELFMYRDTIQLFNPREERVSITQKTFKHYYTFLSGNNM